MTHSTTIHCTPDELVEMIRKVIREELGSHLDRPVSRAEVAKMWNCSLQTVDNMIRKGEIKRCNPDGMQPRFKVQDITNHYKYSSK